MASSSKKPESKADKSELSFPRDLKTSVRFDQWTVPGKQYRRCKAGSIVKQVTEVQHADQLAKYWTEIPNSSAE